ncbi:hypothetical protein P7C71_g4714, partial [Lecanoromycetidae sp. Uapishka_2]
MAHVILTGCTGTAGSAVLARCIASSTISKVTILSRRPVKQASGVDKVNVIIHNDFTSYPDDLLQQLKGAVGCVWALGTPAGQVTADKYKMITLDYPLAAALAFASLGPAFNFVYISGEGATRSPGRFTALFARTKGLAEASLLDLIPTHPSLRIFNVRPAFIDDTGAQLKEGKKSFSYALMDKMAPALRLAWPNGVSPTGKLAEVLVRCVENQGTNTEIRENFEGRGVTWEGQGQAIGLLIENTGVRRLAGL